MFFCTSSASSPTNTHKRRSQKIGIYSIIVGLLVGTLGLLYSREGYAAFLFPLVHESTFIPNGNSDGLATTTLSLQPKHFLLEHDGTLSVAWGDFDNDGDLDLVTGNSNSPLILYENRDGALDEQPIWRSSAQDQTFSLAWGDVNKDGYLDLAAGNAGAPIKIYLNQGGTLSSEPAWQSADTDPVRSIAWGDMNGDGALDLVAVGANRPLKIYFNLGTSLKQSADWTTNNNIPARSVAVTDADNDGDLDLAVGSVQQNRVYFLAHNNGTVEQQDFWQATDTATTESIAWGDINGDGLPDLVAGNVKNTNQLYLNNGDRTFSPSAWQPVPTNDNTRSIALGDVDNDGWLDIVVGNTRDAGTAGEPIRIYRNNAGVLETNPAWESVANDAVRTIALGDMDGDGDLDLAVGVFGGDIVYQNRTSTLRSVVAWQAPVLDTSNSVVWGDYDSDGDLDLAVGNGLLAGNTREPDYLYRNDGQANFALVWESPTDTRTRQAAWGDVDGDGDLDLAFANMGFVTGDGAVNELYINNGTTLSLTPLQITADADDSTTLAWGDVDGDGDLDLAVGNFRQKSKVYQNNNGQLGPAIWQSNDADQTQGIAWGDIDNDGDLDLAIVNSGAPVRVYMNQNGVLDSSASWQSAETLDGRTIAWGDMNGDGLLDLAVGCDGQPTRVYLNNAGQLREIPDWYASDTYNARSVAWGDVDGDGDLDLAIGNDNEPSKIYINELGTLALTAAWQSPSAINTRSIAWGDMDNDGDIDLAMGNGGVSNTPIVQNQIYRNDRPTHQGLNRAKAIPPTIELERFSDPVTSFSGQSTTALALADFYSTAAIRDRQPIPLTFSLYHPSSTPVGRIRAYYSLAGALSGPRSEWHVAEAAAGTKVTDLPTAPYPTKGSNTHKFVWDLWASDFFGQSDNVVVRIEALPDFRPRPNSAPGPFLWPYVATQSLPFRVRGTQIRVVDGAGKPRQDALVYHLREGQITNGQLIGRIDAPFRTDVHGYLSGRGELRRGDQLIALYPAERHGTYTVYHTSARAVEDAALAPGGLATHVVETLGVQTLVVSPQNPLLLFDLAVSLEWDASNDAAFLAKLSDDLRKSSAALYDWTNGQAALGKVTVRQAKEQWDEADIRIYASNQVRPVANRGGIVREETIVTLPTPHEPITATRGEIRIGAVWNRYGDATSTGNDWPNVLAHELGHYLLFLEDTYVGIDEDSGLLIPIESCTGTAMTDPYDEDSSELRYEPTAWARDCGATLAELPEWELMERAYRDQAQQPIFKKPTVPHQGPSYMPFAFTQVTIQPAPVSSTPLLIDNTVPLLGSDKVLANGRTYLRKSDRIIDLGRPVLGSVTAHGAAEGDELCVFTDANYACVALTNRSTPQLAALKNWQPTISLTPVNTTTFKLLVGGTAVGNLSATIYPSGENPQQATFPANVEQTITLNHPAVEVWLDIQGSQPGQRVITEYTVGSGPGRLRSHDGPGRLRSHDGPVSTGDGRVTLYPPAKLDKDTFIALQTATTLPPLPAGLTVIGRSYYVRPSKTIASYAEGSIAFQYVGLDVLLTEVPEKNLSIYHWSGTRWQRLATQLNRTQNFVTAPLVNEGLYVLVSSYQIPLRGTQWNGVAYPLQESMAIEPALASIDGSYSIVYGYDTSGSEPMWQVYDPAAPEWVNDLYEMRPGSGYWIYATASVTWTISPKRPSEVIASTLPPVPPATVYGTLTTTNTTNLAVGLPVRAYIGGTLCGEATTKEADGNIVYMIKIAGADMNAGSLCGELERDITLEVNGQTFDNAVTWNNRMAQRRDFVIGSGSGGENGGGENGGGENGGGSSTQKLFLPFVSR